MEEIESAAPAETPGGESPESAAEPLAAVTAEELLPPAGSAPEPPADENRLKAVLEAIIYVTEEPLTRSQIASALGTSPELADKLLGELTLEYEKPEHGLAVREVAGGYKMATKAEHHEAVRAFVRSLKAPLKLSLAALETLAVIAYKQPVTTPEVLEIRGVQGAGVMKTLLERKLIAASGRKNVIGKPVLYKTTKEFLIQFGLKDLSELPSLKEFEEIRRMSIPEPEEAAPAAASETVAETPGDEAGRGEN
jgi:segregation and condensation protein B